MSATAEFNELIDARPVTDAKAARSAIDLLDELLDGMGRDSVEGVAALVAENAVVEHVEGAQRRRFTGGAAAEQLVELVRNDPARGGRQRRGDVFVQLLDRRRRRRFDLDDGSEAERIYVLSSGRTASTGW